MFDIQCSACERRRLVFPNQVLGIVNDDAGIHVVYRCWCGATGAWHNRPQAARPTALAS